MAQKVTFSHLPNKPPETSCLNSCLNSCLSDHLRMLPRHAQVSSDIECQVVMIRGGCCVVENSIWNCSSGLHLAAAAAVVAHVHAEPDCAGL